MMSVASPEDCHMSDPLAAAGELKTALSSAAQICVNEPLARRTTLRVGGPVDLYVEPASEEDLSAVLQFCSGQNLPFFVLGRGSNLLVKDGGFRGVAISLAQSFFSQIERTGQRLRCGAGVKLKTLAIEARRHQLSGMEFFEGIPGSVGGALRMNAGAMGSATFEVVESVRLMDFQGKVTDQSPAQLGVQYRSCAALKSHVAVSAVFRGEPGFLEKIETRMKEFSAKRWDSQPAAPSAGCMFKNPPTVAAGKLIDELGLKGLRVGGAVVSAEHGNFIVNKAGATARDVLELISQIQARARKERGIELHTEVEIIGE
jgi:UDP-N-acetylenolpyruvoylglucosamine reductase